MSRALLLPAARFEIASLGELVGEPSRVAMLLALLDGSARPATELADLAGVTRATASSHLRRLREGGLLSVEPRGRHRYFRLAGERVADLIETLALAGPRGRTRPSARDPARQALERARTCYRHLAGRLGVACYEALERQHLLSLEGGGLRLTRRGQARFEALGLKVARWPSGKACLDWTERRSHLGGALGTLVSQHLFDLGWIARRKDGNGRAVEVTPLGRCELVRQLALPEAGLEP